MLRLDSALGAVSVAVAHPDRPVSVKSYRDNLAFRSELGAVPAKGGAQKGVGGTDPATLVDETLVVPGAVLAGAVIVRVSRNSFGLGGGQKGLAQGVDPVRVGDRKLTVGAAEVCVRGCRFAARCA